MIHFRDVTIIASSSVLLRRPSVKKIIYIQTAQKFFCFYQIEKFL